MKEIWTKQRCGEESLKYKTRGEFCNRSGSAYNKCLKMKWLDELCGHMIKIKNHKGYWTKERCQIEALKYNHRGEFSTESTSAYSKSWKNGWLDEICSHMKFCGNKYKRCVYTYKFKDKVIYVGLTYNLHKRNLQHEKRGSVFNYTKECGIPVLTKVTDYINIEDAKKEEKKLIKSYKDNGWTLLNSSSGGECGGGKKKWTKERCQIEALKYDNVKDYREKCLSYRSATRNGWLDEICSHMNRRDINPRGHWTKERCQIEALKYKSRMDFSDNCPVGYTTSIKNGWLDEICSHMIKKDTKPKGHWTKKRCHIESLKYKSRSEFQKNDISPYMISNRNGWLDEICSHMIETRKPNGYWSKEKCIEEALKYKTKEEFRINSRTPHDKCVKYKWIDLSELYQFSENLEINN